MDRAALTARLRQHLDELQRLRSAQRPEAERRDRNRLRSWQSQRLATTYRDLLADERYRPAAEFFLADLYGPKDDAVRDAELARVLPKITRLLPPQALATLADGLRMDVLTESLDADMVTALQATGGL